MFLLCVFSIVYSKVVGIVIIRLRIVVINVVEILFVISLGLLVLNRVIVWKVLIILVMVFNRFISGVIIEMILMIVRLWFSLGILVRMVLVKCSFNVLVLVFGCLLWIFSMWFSGLLVLILVDLSWLFILVWIIVSVNKCLIDSSRLNVFIIRMM